MELFDYNDGYLYWKIVKSNKVKVGDIAGYINSKGYRTIGINNKLYYAHRLIFLYHHGYLPEFLDHIECNKLNNNISNLRAATHSQNGMNQKKHKSRNGKSTYSKYKGVTYDIHHKRWQSQIMMGEKLKFLGRFVFEIEAAKSYHAAAIKYYGEFARLNFNTA